MGFLVIHLIFPYFSKNKGFAVRGDFSCDDDSRRFAPPNRRRSLVSTSVGEYRVVLHIFWVDFGVGGHYWILKKNWGFRVRDLNRYMGFDKEL